MVFARTSPGFCQDFARVWRWSLAMGRPPNRPLEGQNRPSEGQKSSSDRPGDSQEQPKSLQDNKFRVFSYIFEKSWKKLRPKSAQERPRSAKEGPKVDPGGLPRRPGGPSGTILRLRNSKRAVSNAICRATPSRTAFVTIFGQFSKHARKCRTSISKRPYGVF